jgi:hypothetical protein
MRYITYYRNEFLRQRICYHSKYPDSETFVRFRDFLGNTDTSSTYMELVNLDHSALNCGTSNLKQCYISCGSRCLKSGSNLIGPLEHR